MGEQKPGEYKAANGEVRAFRVVPPGIITHEISDRPSNRIAKADARAAGEALIALSDHLTTEVVELGKLWRLVRHPTGSVLEHRWGEHEDCWEPARYYGPQGRATSSVEDLLTCLVERAYVLGCQKGGGTDG